MKTLPTTKQQIIGLLDLLSSEEQDQVLAFVQSLSDLPEGTTGKDLVAFFQQYAPASPKEVANMKQILKEIESD